MGSWAVSESPKSAHGDREEVRGPNLAHFLGISVFTFLDLRPSHLTPGNFGKGTGTSIIRANLVVTSFIMSPQRKTGNMLYQLKDRIVSKMF